MVLLIGWYLLFDVVKGGGAYDRRRWEAQMQGGFRKLQEMHHHKFFHHQNGGFYEYNFASKVICMMSKPRQDGTSVK